MKKAVIMSENDPQIEITWEPLVHNSMKLRILTDNLSIKIPHYLRSENATFNDFINFLETRCPPRTRFNIDDILRRYGLKFYDPMGMCRKSYGRSATDYLWIDFDDSGLRWEDIKIRP